VPKYRHLGVPILGKLQPGSVEDLQIVLLTGGRGWLYFKMFHVEHFRREPGLLLEPNASSDLADASYEVNYVSPSHQRPSTRSGSSGSGKASQCTQATCTGPTGPGQHQHGRASQAGFRRPRPRRG